MIVSSSLRVAEKNVPGFRVGFIDINVILEYVAQQYVVMVACKVVAVKEPRAFESDHSNIAGSPVIYDACLRSKRELRLLFRVQTPAFFFFEP